MLRIYDNAFSPFARKVRITCALKDLDPEIVDGLLIANRDQLRAENPRLEVPALVHDGVTVINSADIVAYLEQEFPEPALVPPDRGERARARAWERCADTYIDAILTDISFWFWAERDDQMPDGLLDAARRDLDDVYAALEQELRDRDFLCGELSIADVAIFPHFTSTRTLDVAWDVERFPKLTGWFKRLRGLPAFADDVARVKTYFANAAAQGGAGVERRKIFWRGDRIEWLLARGHHQWFAKEIAEDRVLWPGPAIPTPH